jgi:adenylate cyclase
MSEFEQAIALDPGSFEANYFYARANFAEGKLDRAATLFERAAELKPDDYQSLILLIQIYRSLRHNHRIESSARRGVERAERELAVHPENPRPAYLGAAALLTLGDKERSKEWLSRALAINPDDVLTQYNVACIYSQMGETENALNSLEQLLPHANHETKAWIKHDSDFESLRGNPRFQKILTEIG